MTVNSNLPVLKRAQSVAPSNGAKLPKQPITIINNPPRMQTARRGARQAGMIEIGGGLVPKLKCSRKDLGVASLALSILIGTVFAAKYGFKKLFSPKEKDDSDDSQTPADPPKIQTVADCVNNAGEPKKVLVPNMLVEGGLSILGGREGACKTVLGHQLAVELARGYGELVEEGIEPQSVIIVDGELDDDDYVDRFGNMDIPRNITRISDCDFPNLNQLAEYIKGVVSALLSPATIIIDNLVALSLEALTGKAVNAFFRDLKKIQRESSQTITFVIVDHIGKAPEGQTLDNSLLAGSAKYPIGTVLECRHFINGGSELIYDRIDLPGEGASVYPGDFFMSTQTFSPEQVATLSQQYDLFDMEAYAAALFCRNHGIPFYCYKAVSDNLDGTIKDWRSILSDIRQRFTVLLKDF